MPVEFERKVFEIGRALTSEAVKRKTRKKADPPQPIPSAVSPSLMSEIDKRDQRAA